MVTALGLLWVSAALVYNAVYAYYVTEPGGWVGFGGKSDGLSIANAGWFLLSSVPAFVALGVYLMLARRRAWILGMIAGLAGLIFSFQGAGYLAETAATREMDPMCLAAPCPDRVTVIDSETLAQIHELNALRVLLVASVVKNGLSLFVPLLTLGVLAALQEYFRHPDTTGMRSASHVR